MIRVLRAVGASVLASVVLLSEWSQPTAVDQERLNRPGVVGIDPATGRMVGQVVAVDPGTGRVVSVRNT
ncbi:hypothetical protein GCM10010123_13820 [Pilimelia anulata]|uniref:Uncharacterized protein n=1 Tax=Pilimelia anulata TaxID=53371 RepID=A0A8J3F8C4_9ACTN|nr:hypothetical protein [Pilimelia anulata]GGJ85355.1 hypothetical protein GCM10010123_13820 [Pilimelia anulata]